MTIHFGGLSNGATLYRADENSQSQPLIFSFDVLRTFVTCFDLLHCCLAKMDDSEMGPVVLSVCSIVTPCVVYSLNFVLHQQLPLAVLSLNNPESQDEDALCRNKRFHEWMVLMNVINIFL